MTQATVPDVEPLALAIGRAPAPPGIGLVLLATELTAERDLARLQAEGIATYATRIAFENPTTPQTLARMGPRLAETMALLAPVAPLAAVYYGCTSGTVTLGRAALEAAVAETLPGTPLVTPPHAALAAFDALGARRIALLAPYLPETSAPMAAWFAGHGVEVVRAACLGIADDRDIARTDADTLLAAASLADHPEAQAVFLACTALPALAIADRLEARLGKPVVTANQAALWQLRGLAGRRTPLAGHGRLLTLPPT
ncbi:MAG: aspartate/glutamate racemase family protein [Pseudomonadota bacterium]